MTGGGETSNDREWMYSGWKIGAKKYKESGSSDSTVPRLKRVFAYPEDWQERDLDLTVMYSTDGGGMPHGRLAISDGVFRKSEVVAAKRRNIKPSNSMCYEDLLRRNQYFAKRHKNHSKHLQILFNNAGLPVPKELEDDSMEDSVHVNQSSPSIESGSTPLMALSCPEEQSDTPSSTQNQRTRAREDSPILDEL